MSDTLVLQHVYPNGGYGCMLAQTFVKHASFCESHKLDFQVNFSDCEYPISLGDWEKVKLIRSALNRWQNVIYVDADAVILGDLRGGLVDGRIGVTWHEAPERHYNVGMLYVSKSDRVLAFVDEWLSRAPGNDQWHEQRIFNDMAFDPKLSDVVERIPATYNSCWQNNWVDHPVVATFHGCGSINSRLALMQKVML